ncbi:MAG: type IV toxin-antitoxin system AbiEi family antitoxin domain-containing protein [Actinomycetota bacterium]|nr:type IV toxin-antitoxin system AbiEi family antitoxin domain-containing protein [Actinomycetota bacterium]
MSVVAVWLAVGVKPIDVAVTRLAARQYSLAHRQQALDLGMTPRQIHERLASGWLVPVHRGVYRLPGGPASPVQSLLAACLAAGPTAVASHRSAAALWRLRGVDVAPTEITVTGDRHCRLTDVIVHRTDLCADIDVSRCRRIPVMTPARTLFDLGTVVAVEGVESALEDALMRRLVTLELLGRTLSRLGGPGRRGARVLRGLVEERDPATAPTQSVLEDGLLRVLRHGGLPEPVRQYEVDGVRLDFAYPHLRLGIEADSRIWHGGRLDVQRNSHKGNVLVARGWRVLHFTWADVRRRPASIVDAVARELVVAWPA